MDSDEGSMFADLRRRMLHVFMVFNMCRGLSADQDLTMEE